MNEAPSFWWQSRGLAAWTLAPFSWVYGSVADRRMAAKPWYKSQLPVLCIGNFIVGGAGKTPTAIAVSCEVVKRGLVPGFLSRGYGGQITRPTVVDLEKHNSRDVGDEAILLAQHHKTVVSPDRIKGGLLLEQSGIDFIIMDDGFQNPALHKDYSLAVVDSERGIGNGFVIPAGPLRAGLETQLALASAVLIIGKQTGSDKLIRAVAMRAKPVYEAAITATNPEQFKGKKVLAFAGIANPEKFFATLNSAGADIVETRKFGDHHTFSDEEAKDILIAAKRSELGIVTTSKDAARLSGLGGNQQELQRNLAVLEIELTFDSGRILSSIVNETIVNAKSITSIGKTAQR